jgi:hypothetical protein
MTSVVGLTEILDVTVTPAPGSIQDANLTKVAGTAVTTGAGTSNAGTQRVVLSSDSVVSTKTALTATAPASATVGITSSQVLAANANRKSLVLVNTSLGNISIGFGATAVLNSGITLYPNGTFCMDEYMYTTAAITAIAANASSNLAIQEWQ